MPLLLMSVKFTATHDSADALRLRDEIRVTHTSLPLSANGKIFKVRTLKSGPRGVEVYAVQKQDLPAWVDAVSA